MYSEWVSVLGVGECTRSGSVQGNSECHKSSISYLSGLHLFSLSLSLSVCLSVCPVPGIIGNLQALEVLKIAAGKDCILLPHQLQPVLLPRCTGLHCSHSVALSSCVCRHVTHTIADI